jgi:hypothetical protein
MPRNFSPGAMEQAWMGRFKKPTQPYIYAPHQEGLSINPIQYNPKDNNPYNKYVVNRYLPTPNSPVNPIPYDDIQLYSGHQNRDNRGLSVGYVMEDGKRRDIMADEYNAIMGSSVQGGTKLENTDYAMGGKLNKLGVKNSLWNNIRANKGSGKEPTKEMLEQEAKIKAEYMYGGEMPDMYGKGGYVVKRSSERKGKTHVVTGPDGTKKYFGDSKLGQHPNDPARKKAFYARHKKNLAGNPYFRAFARKTWADGGEIDNAVGQQYIPDTPYLKSGLKQYSSAPQEYINDGYWNYRNPALDSDLENNLEYVPGLGMIPSANDASAALHQYSKNPTKGNGVSAAYEVGSMLPFANEVKLAKPGMKVAYKYIKVPIDAALNAVTDERIIDINPTTRTGSKAAKTNSNVTIRKATHAMGGRMNQAQMLNQGKMRMGSDAPDGEVWKDIGAGAFGVLEGTLDTVTMGATDKLTDAAYKGLQKLGGSDASQVRQQDMIHGFGNIGGAAIGAAVNPASGMTAVNQGIKGLGQGVGNINEDTQGIGNAISGLSSLTGLMPSGGGLEKLSAMGAQMSYKQGGLMHINEGGTHEQNALGGVPIGPNALVEQGETINNDFVFSDRLKPKGSKKTYAQLSKSVDTKYRLRPDDKLSKEAKQMDLDRLAMQQEAQKDEMSTKYMQKAMAMGGTILGPISQSMNVTNGQNTLLAMGGLMSNFMEPTPQYYNPADLDNQYAHGGSIHIKPENRGKFTASANRAGMGVQEFASHVLANKEDYSSTQVKRANFARNFGGKKAMGGNMYAWGGNPLNDPNVRQGANNLADLGYIPEMDQTIYDASDFNESSTDLQGRLNAIEDPYISNLVNARNPFEVISPNTEANFMGQKQGNAFDRSSGAAQNPYPEVGNTGYLTNLAGNLVKAGMVATSKPPIYNPSVKFGRMNANPAERLAMQEGRREIQGTKDIIRNNATSSGQYLTNASLMGSSAANKLAGTIGGIRQQYDTQNVGIGNQEAQLNQQITAANNLAKETFRDNRLNQYNKILDSVIGANQQRFATDVHANNYQNQVLDLLKSGDYQIGFDANGKLTIVPTTK